MREIKLRTVDLIIKNAKIFMDQQVYDANIAIEGEKIVKITKDSKILRGEQYIDAKGQLVIPGVIDIHTHLRDLQYKDKEDFYTGTCAAAHGGITTAIDMPNTNPPTVSTHLLKQKTDIAKKKTVINVGFYGGIPDKLEDIDSFRKLGIFGFKLYLSHSLSQFDIEDSEQLQNLFRKLKEEQLSLLIHAERKKDIEEILEQKKDLGLSSQELYLKCHSEEVEKRAIEYILHLNEPINCSIHFCHISTASGLQCLQEVKKKGKKISVEVTPHHLFLTLKDLKLHGSFAKMVPPLRTPKDIAALWRGLNEGIVDIIATDHAPHTLSEKKCEFSQAANGIPGFETLLPLLFTALHDGKISLSRLVQLISENPAKFLKLPTKGKIKVGFDADLTIIDLNKRQQINAANFFTKAKYSPFDKWWVRGIPTVTIVNGKIVMQEGEIIAPKGSGTIICPQM